MATSAHQGQVDKAGKNYILHPVAVANSLGPDDPDAVVVALLHDVLEDTLVTEQEIVQAFSSEIAAAVRALTRAPQEDYQSFIQRCAKNPLARKVKIADLRHNIDLGRLKKVTAKDEERVQNKYSPALAYLLNLKTS